MDASRFGFFQGGVDPDAGTVERFLDGFEEDRHDLAVDTHLQGDVADRAGDRTRCWSGSTISISRTG